MNILYLDSCNSTNDELYKLALDVNNTYDAVVSKVQFAGKGTKGRSFESPSNTGIYLSILLKGIPDDQILNVTPVVGVLVRRSIFSVTNKLTKIKPVNDLYYNMKKVCGILCQANSSNGKNNFIIVGIGINLFAPQNGFSKSISNIAGYLLDDFDINIKNQLIEDIVKRILDLPIEFQDTCIIENLLNEYNENLLSDNDIKLIKNGL